MAPQTAHDGHSTNIYAKDQRLDCTTRYRLTRARYARGQQLRGYSLCACVCVCGLAVTISIIRQPLSVRPLSQQAASRWRLPGAALARRFVVPEGPTIGHESHNQDALYTVQDALNDGRASRAAAQSHMDLTHTNITSLTRPSSSAVSAAPHRLTVQLLRPGSSLMRPIRPSLVLLSLRITA